MRSTIKRETTGKKLKNSKIFRGDTENIIVRFMAGNLIPENFEFKFTCKISELDPDSDAVIQKEATVTKISDTIIEAKFSIASGDTEFLEPKDKLYYDVQMKIISFNQIYTLEKGCFEIEADITQDNS